MDSIVSDVTRESIDLIYKELKKKHNKKKLSYIFNYISNLAINSIKPYMYTIMAILIVIFLMNCFQFYYYIKLNTNFKSINVSEFNRI